MFAAGQTGAAEEKFGEVFELMGGIHHLASGPLRDRAFGDAMNFAQRAAQKPGRNAEANRLFDLAEMAAQMPAQEVAYRVARRNSRWR